MPTARHPAYGYVSAAPTRPLGALVARAQTTLGKPVHRGGVANAGDRCHQALAVEVLELSAGSSLRQKAEPMLAL
jgi:hypothetical protein